MAVEVIGPSHISAARRMSALAGSDGSSAFRAVSAPQTGSVATSEGGGLAHDAPLSLRYPDRYQPTEERENHADRARQAI
jgi:hypothetical protein